MNGFNGDNGPAVAAFFWDPIPSAVSSGGDLYLADYENSRIREITSNTGIVTTFAGSGVCKAEGGPLNVSVCQGGFSGDGGPARTAWLNYAQAAALDVSGNVYIADTINHRIRLVDRSTDIIYTIAGDGVNGFSGDGGPATSAEMSFPSGIAVDGAGRVNFSDESNNCIRLLTPMKPAPDRFAPGARR